MKIRIAVAIDASGAWNAVGWGGPDAKCQESDMMDLAIDPIGAGEARYWIEAEIALPAAQVIAATAKQV